MKILYLEDNNIDIDLTQRAISNAFPECTLHNARTIAEANKLLQEKVDYDLLLLDLNLPDGNGIEVLTNVRKKNIPVPVIILTGISDEEIAITALKAGADDYLAKTRGYLKKLPEAINYAILNFKKNHRDNLKIINVLYAEWHEADIEFTKRHFNKHEPYFKIFSVPNVAEALKLLPISESEPAKFDILLMDYRLPGTNAIEAIKIIRQERKLSIPIALVTGHGNEEVAVQALKFGANDYLVKREHYLLRLPSMLVNAFQKHQLEIKQKEITASELKYKLLADNLVDVIFTLDLNLNFTYLSPSIEILKGYKPEELIHKPISEVLTTASYQNLLKAIAVFNPVLDKKMEVKPYSQLLELEVIKKDGSVVWTEVKVSMVLNKELFPYEIIGVSRDITNRKIAENELLKSKQEYQSFFEDDLTGDYISTMEGKLLNCNPAYLKILGFSSKEEALNYDMRKVYVNEGNRNELIKKLKENKTLTTFEGDIIRVDGTIINVVANIIGGFDSNGNLKTFKGYIFDQTERKKAIDQLRKLSVAVEQSPATVLMTDIKGNIEYVNKKFTEVTGYSQKEVIGKNPRIFNSGHQSKEVYEQLWQNISSGKEWFGELLNKKKDGSLYWEQASISPIKNDKGKITHFLGVKEDISEKKRAEQVQNIILNISNASQTEMVLKGLMEVIQKELGRIVDTKNFFIAFYNKVNDSFHIPYYKDLGGDDVVDFPASESISGIVIKKGKSLLLNESEMIKLEFEKTGMIGPNSKSWLGVPLRVKGEITGVFVVQSYEDENAYSENDKGILEIISQQISISIERKRNEEQLLKALENAKESDRLKSAFIANMSHEIRTPMNGILGFTGLLKSADLNGDKQQKYLKIIEKSGARLLTTIDDIMNISKIESGLMKISLSEINIKNEIEELYAFFKLETENKGLQLLVVNSIPEDEFIIKTDGDKLHSILVNLIKNAIKFTKQGCVEFGCSKKGNQLEFYVKDTGIGIPKERQSYVFDRFVQADIEDKAVYEGSGLGLAISKSYVEMLGGTIDLESVEGIGSTFRFTIPCQDIKKEIPVAKNELSNDFGVSEIPSLKILIVEDDVIAQLYLEELLSDDSKEILLADNGYKALDLCRENSDIDLILMDIRMPEINGYEVTKQIRQFNKEVIIIAQTAFALSGDRENALEVGCNDYISKPINRDHLVAVIQKYFKK